MAMEASPFFYTLPYPVIENGNLSFPDGNYSVDLIMGEKNKAVIKHKISGAQFIERLLKNNEAKFGCLLSTAEASYKEIHLDDKEEQKIEWDSSIAGEFPIIRPMILYVGDDKKHKLTVEDGVDEIWQGEVISIPKGARLARTEYFKHSEQHNFLRFRTDKNIKDGCFEVEKNTSDGFYFIVKTSEDVRQFSRKKNPLRHAIVTHAMSRCFEILKEDSQKKDSQNKYDWKEYPNLEALSLKLDVIWDDPNFKPDLEATKLHPLKIKEFIDAEEE